MLPMRPGPSSTDSGAPVLTTSRAGAEPARLLIDLDGGAASRHIQMISPISRFVADADDVGHVGRFQSIGHDQRAGYLDYFAHTTFPFM